MTKNLFKPYNFYNSQGIVRIIASEIMLFFLKVFSHATGD